MPLTKKQALAELARRTMEEQADFYVPHAEQQKFHESMARIRGIFAGNRFGKTWAGAMELYWHVTKQHPYWPVLTNGPVRARACSETYQVLKDSMVADTFMKMIPRRFLRGKSWKTAWSESSKKLYFTDEKPILGGYIEFKSYDQDEEAFRGVGRHIIWEDEEAPEALHRENMARLLTCKGGGILIVTMTPIKPSMWVISDIYEAAEKDPRIEVFEGDSLQNPHVDKAAMQLMLDQIKDPVEREARKSGKFTWYAGKIYPDYGDKNRVGTFKPPDDWSLVIGIDPHDTKETAVSFGYWNKKGDLYILDELWLGGGVDQISDQTKVHIENREVEAVLFDPSSDRDPKIHETVSIFSKFTSDRNFPDGMKWISKPGSVWAGIQDVREMVKPNQMSGLPKLFVDPIRCPMTDWQLSHYGLKPPTKAQVHTYNPQPMKVKEDFCDCIRGIVMYGPPTTNERQRRPQEEDRFEMRNFN